MALVTVSLFAFQSVGTSIRPKTPRGKIWTMEELNQPRFKECKFCGCKLRHPKWQRIHWCKQCDSSKRYLTRLF